MSGTPVSLRGDDLLWVQRDAEWRAIPGYEGYYEISEFGDVRSVARRRVRPHVLTPNSHLKYLQISLRGGGRPRTFRYVHRLVLEAFIGPRPEGCEARHLNGVRTDNRRDNLAWGTRVENMRDKQRHGTHAKGERSVLSKLTEAQVAEIRNLWTPCGFRHIRPRRGGVTLQQLAERFGVSTSCVRFAAIGRTWVGSTHES